MLHEATINKAPLEVIKVLIEINPDAANKKDRAKKLAIEYAMDNIQQVDQKDVVNFLLKYSPGAALKQIDKVFKSNRKRREGPKKRERRRRTLDSLPSAQASPAALEKLESSMDSLDAAVADLSSLTKVRGDGRLERSDS